MLYYFFKILQETMGRFCGGVRTLRPTEVIGKIQNDCCFLEMVLAIAEVSNLAIHRPLALPPNLNSNLYVEIAGLLENIQKGKNRWWMVGIF